MSIKRKLGIAFLLLGALTCFLGTSAMQKALAVEGDSLDRMALEILAALFGFFLMILGGIIFSKSFLDF